MDYLSKLNHFGSLARNKIRKESTIDSLSSSEMLVTESISAEDALNRLAQADLKKETPAKLGLDLQGFPGIPFNPPEEVKSIVDNQEDLQGDYMM